MNLMRRKRLDLDISQVELAKRTGIVYSTVSMIERGHIQPSREQKRRLAKALRVKISDLFFDEIADDERRAAGK